MTRSLLRPKIGGGLLALGAAAALLPPGTAAAAPRRAERPADVTIKGQITDEKGTPLPGATVVVKGVTALAAGLSQEQFRQAAWKERYHELAYETKAYFDMQRTRKTYDVVNNTFVNVVGFKAVGPAFQEKYLLWSLPSSEINNNKLTHNPGW